ncbi:MAG TPA: VOC family protein [Candidatus Binataceae bacterium]|nr:VOC family protein [Candidatus Binataceae bacterium]
MAVDLTAIDHIYLSVSNFERSERFYDAVMQALGFRKSTAPIASEPHCHYCNRDFQITIRPAHMIDRNHEPYAPGLHHLCMRAADDAAVDEAARALSLIGIAIDGPRHCPEYAPDYYAVFFNDPDGIRLEVMNHLERRRVIRARWDELEGFVDPLGRLLRKKP